VTARANSLQQKILGNGSNALPNKVLRLILEKA
jgi:hypothetical protein